MTGPRINPQVVFELTAPMAAGVFWLKGKRGSEMQAGLAAALLAVFGLPTSTPVRLRVRLAETWSLLEVQGETPAQPSPAEVQAALVAAVACSAAVLYGNTYAESNLPASESALAPERLN